MSAKFDEIVHSATPTAISSLICELTASVIIDIEPLCYNVMGCQRQPRTMKIVHIPNCVGLHSRQKMAIFIAIIR